MFTKCSIFATLFALTAACSAAAPSPQPDEKQQAQIQKVEQAAPEKTTAIADGAEPDEDSDFIMARHGHGQNRIQRFDTNHDGMLQASEVPERLRTWFTAADANHDNVVTIDELRAYRRAHRGQHQGQGQAHPHAQGQQAQPHAFEPHASDTTL